MRFLHYETYAKMIHWNATMCNQAKSLFFLTVILLLASMPTFGQTAIDLDRGIELFESEKYTRARAVFESIIEESPNNHRAIHYLGRVFLQEKEYDDAIEWLEEGIALNNSSSEYHYWLAMAQLKEGQRSGILKKISLARKIPKTLNKAIELDTDNLDARELLMVFYYGAPGIIGGDKRKGLLELQTIQRQDKKKGKQALISRYYTERNYDAVEKGFLKLLEEDPDDKEILIKFGDFCKDRKMFKKAFVVFEKITKSYPEGLYSHYMCGRMAAQSGENLEKGIKHLDIYLQGREAGHSRSVARAHYRLGTIYQIQGKIDHSRSEYEQALRIYPKLKESKQALNKLK